MQTWCSKCGASFESPSGTPREMNCPKCGTLLPATPGEHRHAKHSHASLKRVYEPIPRSLVYVAGVALALVLTAPFWIYLFGGRSGSRPVISDDSAAIALPPPITNAVPVAPVITESRARAL